APPPQSRTPAAVSTRPSPVAAHDAACVATRRGSTPVNRKYGSTAIRLAPRRRHRFSPAGTFGVASDTKAYSTPATGVVSASRRAAPATSPLASPPPPPP